MKLHFPLLLCLIFSTIALKSQDAKIDIKSDYTELFKAIPSIDDATPEWARFMYEDPLNFEKVYTAYTNYYRSNTLDKNIHTQNYKYWLRQVQSHLGDDGRVDIPSSKEIFEQKKAELRSKKEPKHSRSMMNSWSCIGPNNVYNTGSTPSTRATNVNVYCLGVAPSNTSVIYASMETGGIFKSVDKGLSWTPSSHDYAMGNARDVKVDPLDENKVFVCIGRDLYLSTDGGSIWNIHYSFAENIEQLYIEPTNTSIIYAATADGLYKTNDGGVVWSIKHSGYIYDIEAKPGSTDTFYLSYKNNTLVRPEIFRSIDAGETWSLMDNGYYMPSSIPNSTVYGCKIGVTPADPERVYAGIIANGKAGDNGWIGIYYSLDAGDSWVSASGQDGAPYASGNDPNTLWYVAGYSSGYHQGWYNFDIDVSHNNADRLWIGTIWYCESGNKGQNIEYIRGSRNLVMHADIQDIDVVGDDIWIASDGGINYSNDECQTTEVRMNGLNASDFWGFGHGWNEDTWIGGRYHNGNAASFENYGVGNVVFTGGAESATGYVDQLNNKKAYTSDAGADIIPEALTTPLEGIPNLGTFPTESYFHFGYSEVEWHPEHKNIVYLGKDTSFYKSVDGGVNFSEIYKFNGVSGVRRFEVSRSNPNCIYIIVYHSYWDWRIYKSLDGGSSFNQISTPPYSSGSWRNLSLTINPFDHNEIWVASGSSNNGNKIFSSTDGGNSWSNRYSNVIADEGLKDLIYVPSLDGDVVYAMTNDEFFYFDIDGGVWESYSDGLPVQHKGFKVMPFYRDQKLRMAGAKGIWEMPMINTPKIQAKPTAAKDSTICVQDTVQLDSYSIVDASGASWSWSISPTPQYISNTAIRNPKVVLGSQGDYVVSLTVNHTNGDMDTGSINVYSGKGDCNVNPGSTKALTTSESTDYAIVNDMNLTNVTHFTVAGWWKPNGSQIAYSALFSDGEWCAHCDNTHGLNFDYWGNKLWYKWPGVGNPWANNSGIDIPLDEWSYVALTIEPTKATLYLNDEMYEYDREHYPTDISALYFGKGHYSGVLLGQIDEVSVWTRALSKDEIRRYRHTNKKDQIANDTDLVGYFQFNEAVDSTIIINARGNTHGSLTGGSMLNNSFVPVGEGTSDLQSLSNNQYDYNFSNTDTYIKWDDCQDPQGEIVVSRINQYPASNPEGTDQMQNYWVVNHYDATSEWLAFDTLILTSTDTAFINRNGSNDITIHKRAWNATDELWFKTSDRSNLSNLKVEFDNTSNIVEEGQITFSSGVASFDIEAPIRPCEPDSFPGRMTYSPGNNGDYIEVPALNLNTNTVTFTAWVKPEGVQNSWAGILFSRAGNTTAGLSFANNNELRYHWNGGNYGWASGLVAPQDAWSHVALVIEPNQSTIYLNGVPSVHTTTNAVEEFDGVLRIGNDAAGGSRTLQGEIDEVCIWDRALSQNEIRRLRHLTKEDIVDSDINLRLYLQANEDSGAIIYDKSGSKLHSTMQGNVERRTSNVPAGGGQSELITVNGAGVFGTLALLDFGAAGTYPNGELAISKINVRPDTLDLSTPYSSSYWIINNYGINQSFTGLDSIALFDGNIISPYSQPNFISLFGRTENEFGPNWQNITRSSHLNYPLDQIVFDASGITSFGQFLIHNRGAKGWIGVVDTDWNNSLNWGSGFIPLSTDDVFIPKQVPHYPQVELDVIIRYLKIMPQAKFVVKPSYKFEIKP